MIFDYITNLARNAAGLAIKAGGSAVVKTTNTTKFSINGKLYSKAAADLAALTTANNVADGYTNCITIYLDTAGTATYGMGAAQLNTGLTVAQYDMAGLNTKNIGNKAIIGYVLIKNALGTGANFVGGTTALDLSGITATYIDIYTGTGV